MLLTLAGVVEAAVLGPALYNRSRVEAALEVTEREAPPARPLGASPYLRLRWQEPEAPGWLPPEKLARLGFDASLPASDPAARLRYEKALPKKGFVVLEFEGEAWRAWLRRTEMDLDLLAARKERGEMTREEFETGRETLDRERRTGSRLFAVDVGPNARELRRRYRDAARYVILPGTVRLAVDPAGVVRGTLDSLSPEELRAPGADVLRSPKSSPHPDAYWSQPLEPRYRVKLFSGRLYRPWIGALEPLVNSER